MSLLRGKGQADPRKRKEEKTKTNKKTQYIRREKGNHVYYQYSILYIFIILEKKTQARRKAKKHKASKALEIEADKCKTVFYLF